MIFFVERGFRKQAEAYGRRNRGGASLTKMH
jgi:hypothetical protein